MTACVNRKHTKKVAAVVTASLVGALSLGVAPVAAVADTGIETLALTADEAFAKGSLTKATDDQGRRISIPSDGLLTVEQGKGLKPTQITPAGGADPVDIVTEGEGKNATVKFYAGFNTNSGTEANLSVAGNYTMVLKMDSGDYEDAEFTMNFVVAKSANLADAVLFDNDDDDNDVSDTTFTYNGQPQKIGVAIDGKVLKEGSDYTINNVPTSAGTVSITVEGMGDYAGQTRVVNLTVGKLDLSKASISVSDVKKAEISVTEVTVNGHPFQVATEGKHRVQAQLTYSPNETGAASAHITSSDTTNFTGSATVEFSVVDKLVDTFLYGNDDFSDGLSIDLSEGESFKASRIHVKDGETELPASYYTVSYEDADGNAVEASALQNPGTYYVKVRVNAAACNYAYGSDTESLKVTVKSGTIASEDVVFNYDGKVGAAFEKDYDGKDFLDQLQITVGDLEEGVDYTVKVTKDGDEVDSIVNVGDYEIVLEGSGVDELPEQERTCDVTVSPLDLTAAAIAVNGGDLNAYTYEVPTTVEGEDGDSITVMKPTTVWYLGYTGEELTPSFELGYYTYEDGNPVAEIDPAQIDDYIWNAFPADAVSVTGYDFTDEDGAEKKVDSIKDKGTYEVKLICESDNFVNVDGITANFITVSDSRVAFADVDPNEWYAGAVFDAKQLGYIKGIQGSNLYAPKASITRADALVIISRMAGADTELTEDWLSQNSGYVTRYNDVDPGAYYAKAVAWATKVGVVHGYGDGTFRPDAQITREEFAAYLANYAEAMGKDIAVDTDAVLAEFPDGSQVSDWAEGVVAWAADSDIMGNGGVINPQSQITRAEVAAMAVNYQPDGISSDVIG